MVPHQFFKWCFLWANTHTHILVLISQWGHLFDRIPSYSPQPKMNPSHNLTVTLRLNPHYEAQKCLQTREDEHCPHKDVETGTHTHTHSPVSPPAGHMSSLHVSRFKRLQTPTNHIAFTYISEPQTETTCAGVLMSGADEVETTGEGVSSWLLELCCLPAPLHSRRLLFSERCNRNRGEGATLSTWWSDLTLKSFPQVIVYSNYTPLFVWKHTWVCSCFYLLF